jgi:hypothetical protein
MTSSHRAMQCKIELHFLTSKMQVRCVPGAVVQQIKLFQP